MTRYNVIQRTKTGEFVAIVSGMGRNRGTWDSDHSRSAAYRHARQCRQDDPANHYTVEPES